ncbi:MAG: hypothetical protein LBF12_06510 [Christensenellaceae bacterium]|jgi:hypothetical protein|nr:hypothetical protein [Christensenellaceae bacterium]
MTKSFKPTTSSTGLITGAKSTAAKSVAKNILVVFYIKFEFGLGHFFGYNAAQLRFCGSLLLNLAAKLFNFTKFCGYSRKTY